MIHPLQYDFAYNTAMEIKLAMQIDANLQIMDELLILQAYINNNKMVNSFIYPIPYSVWWVHVWQN